MTNKLIRFCQRSYSLFARIFYFLREGYQQRVLLFRLKKLKSILVTHVNEIFNSIENDWESFGPPYGKKIERLHQTVKGLHSLLTQDDRFTYSILIPVYQAEERSFRKTVESALKQTAPQMEVIIGFARQQNKAIYQILKEFEQQYHGKFKHFQIDSGNEESSISAITNFIAQKASGNFLLLVDSGDWIRPDLLYRYEQTLRLSPNPSNTVLYCNEYKINEEDEPIIKSGFTKPETPSFPYIFTNCICHCLLIPKVLWDRVEGMRFEYCEGNPLDICLRLDVIGAEFHNVPCYLYASRVYKQVRGNNISHKEFTKKQSLNSLSEYFKKKNLSWSVQDGYSANSYRAIPNLERLPKIHVVMPFKDQKKLTLNAVQSVLKQDGVIVKITAVDNYSSDHSIAAELRKLDCEVLDIKEPFNYSRLNNSAVKETKIGKDCELILFLNNDVELDDDALVEMSRWIYQPKIGMVGCRLHYPNGLLQHGGLEYPVNRPFSQIIWNYSDCKKPFEKMNISRNLRVVEAVTTACALVKRDIFIELEGFDEIWYPIAYGDTNFAIRLKKMGLYCFYTPFASGIHHESVSRKLGNIEDYETLTWLDAKTGSKE